MDLNLTGPRKDSRGPTICINLPTPFYIGRLECALISVSVGGPGTNSLQLPKTTKFGESQSYRKFSTAQRSVPLSPRVVQQSTILLHITVSFLEKNQIINLSLLNWIKWLIPVFLLEENSKYNYPARQLDTNPSLSSPKKPSGKLYNMPGF